MFKIIINRMGSKIMDKSVEKLMKKEGSKLEQQQDGRYYIGIQVFGVELYAMMKVAFRVCLVPIFLFLLLSLGLEDGAFIAGIMIFFGLFMYAMVSFTKKTSGVIMYTNSYLIIQMNSGKTYTLSLDGLKSITVKGRNMVYEGNEGTVKVLGGGKGFAAYMDYMNWRRPDLIKPLYQNNAINYAINVDRAEQSRNMHQ